MGKCPDCEGFGRILLLQFYEDPCQTCEGEGSLEESTEEIEEDYPEPDEDSNSPFSWYVNTTPWPVD